MKTGELIKQIMTIKEVRTNELARKMGVIPRVLTDRFRSENITVDKLNEILRSLDYKLVVVPVNSRTGKDSFEIV